MKRFIVFLFLSFSIWVSAQKTEQIKLNQNIKDKSSRTKSLTVIDNRSDKNIGTVTYKGETVGLKFPGNDLKSDIEKWFTEDNKARGSNDIVLLFEEIKVSEFKETQLAKAKVKISSFINRNGRYYFINRYNNTLAFNPKLTPNVPRTISIALSTILSTLINDSYSHIAFSTPIAETDLNNYEAIVGKNIKYLNVPELTPGVYTDFRSFYLQTPKEGYYVDKNKKGKVTGIKNREDLLISSEEIFGYVEDGKAYRLTPVGFLAMPKDDKGYYVVSSRQELFPPQNNNAMMIGAMTGGMLGALIGAAIDSSGSGRRNPNMELSNVYIDPLTGEYSF
ncbi:hypothetical protein FY557_03720 [Chryseobacterium sp. SN22]|uniref:hypothetical protein n=1 Tax=Chryseobacterium sp. SN22 TaxID=2606431 RepID=UPI0011ECF5EE|nr:hypothetical protein [Chryseobacterium sp. SN22]KAA0129828.1 hypothetical protein FY557_03720 [Chryseobacterium sp. SN22]